MARLSLLVALAVLATSYLIFFLRNLARAGQEGAPASPGLGSLLTGFATNFFDTLGIGSFATTTSIFRFWNMVPDELIPGTLNAGHTLPVVLQAFIFISAIQVDLLTLVLMIAAAVLGGWFGAGRVARLPRRAIQLGVGCALLVAVGVMLASQLELFPTGGTALELHGWRLVAAVVGTFVFAAISTLGVGLYAPIMTLVSLLGMNPIAAFPIMMGAGAFLMPVASARFIWRKSYFAPMAAGLTAGGLLAVPLAAFVVKSLPLAKLRYLVMAIVLYAAVLMLRSAFSRDPETDPPAK